MRAATKSTLTAEQVLQREYLEARATLLDLAAFFDRLDRAGGAPDSDPRPAKLRRGLELILSGSTDRAEQLLQLLSRPYDPAWRTQFVRTPR